MPAGALECFSTTDDQHIPLIGDEIWDTIFRLRQLFNVAFAMLFAVATWQISQLLQRHKWYWAAMGFAGGAFAMVLLLYLGKPSQDERNADVVHVMAGSIAVLTLPALALYFWTKFVSYPIDPGMMIYDFMTMMYGFGLP